MQPIDPDEWRAIPGFPGYEASRSGQIRSFRRRRIPHVLKPSRVKDKAYVQVSLVTPAGGSKSITVHRLIALTFLGPVPDGFEVCHNNGVGTDCRAANLRYDTHVNNQADRIKHGTANRGARNWSTKLSPEDVIGIRRRAAAGDRRWTAMAASLGVSEKAVRRVAEGSSWGWL